MTEATLSAIKILLPTVLAFIGGILFAPAWIDSLNQKKMWKKKTREQTIDGREASEFKRLHEHKEVGTPRFGGVIIWVSVFATILITWILSQVFENGIFSRLNFLSRDQTWLPAFALLVGATVGLLDDYYEVKEKGDYFVGGLSLKKRLLSVFALGLGSGWWFYDRLGIENLFMPFAGDIFFGVLIIPLFIITMIGIYSGGVIDGIDGLSGGVFATIFGSYGIIAFTQDQFNLAAFCFVIVGGILAFLWFNVPPAKVYLSETGSMALTVTLSVVAFLTDQVFLLLIIAFPLLITTLSNILQLLYRRLFKKKLFKIAPIHHHFEAIGWPAYQVAMRYWIFSLICAFTGTIIALIG